MKCPRCGQETVNISNKHICTACGIVISEPTPRDQVLNQIRSKVASQNARAQATHSAPKDMDTQQPNVLEVATKKEEKPTPNHEMVAEKTLDQISKEMMMLQNSLPKEGAEDAQTVNIQETDGERVIPRLETVGVAPQAPQQAEIPIQAQPIQPVEISQPPEATSVVAPAYANSTPASEQAIYPSHQVNPIILRALIGLVVVVLLTIGGYVVYSSLSGTGKFTDNMIKYLGENVFK